MKPLRDAMRREAGRVWRDKARAEGLGLFLNEETITESTLLNLATGFHGRGLSVRLFSKAAEKKNGADWEFWFVQGIQAVGLRVQAKRLFPGGTYNSLQPRGPQIKTLISCAGNCCPIYVFYNDAFAYPSSLPTCSCGEYRPQSYLGCTLAPAAAVLSAGSNSTYSLHGIAIPWHCLLCESAAKKMSMPDVIAKNLNDNFGRFDDWIFKVVKTPEQFLPYVVTEVQNSPELTESDGYGEPQWLAGYLAERMLAGVALVGSAAEAE